jgi:tetratricopeptide (TPR) repeat protein
LAVLAGYFLLRAAVIGVWPQRPDRLDNPLAHVGIVPRCLTALEVAGRYLWLMVWPQRLSPDYSYNQIPVVNSPWASGVLLAAFAWGGLIGVACWSYRGTRRAFLCVGFTLVTFLLASNFVVPVGTIMGERLFYLPSAGLCLLAGVAWQRAMEWCRDRSPVKPVRWVGLALLAALLGLLSARTVLRNRDWRDQGTLFLRALEVAPNSAKVRFNLGGVYADREMMDEALREYQASVAILPSARVYRGLGTIYLKKRLPEAAIAEFRKAIALDPRDAEAYSNLGYVLLSQGSIEEAITALKTAILLDPHLADAHYTLGRAFAQQERWPEAIAEYEEARRLKPDFAEASYALGLALEETGQYQVAAQAFEEVLRLKPGLKMAHRRLAELYRMLGDPEKAQEHLRQAGKAE